VIEAMNLTKRYGAKVAVGDLSFVTERAWHNPRIGSAMDAVAQPNVVHQILGSGRSADLHDHPLPEVTKSRLSTHANPAERHRDTRAHAMHAAGLGASVFRNPRNPNGTS
jgi:hypothetical protein